MKKNCKFPPGGNAERVKRVLEHYEAQSEDEASYEMHGQTIMEVPTDIVPAVRELIAKRNAA